MPWRPPSVGDKHDARWNRISRSKRAREPLCRLCKAAGRYEPATIVDHIRPLADGGTHDESNLMPLCKACHDGVKTPADKAARKAASTCEVRMRCLSMGAPAHGLDMRSMRRGLAQSVGWDRAHALTIAAMSGIVEGLRSGQVQGITHAIAYDTCMEMRALALQKGVSIEVDAFDDDSLALGMPSMRSDEYQWLRSRMGSERAMRSARTHGTQAQRASTHSTS